MSDAPTVRELVSLLVRSAPGMPEQFSDEVVRGSEAVADAILREPELQRVVGTQGEPDIMAERIKALKLPTTATLNPGHDRGWRNGWNSAIEAALKTVPAPAISAGAEVRLRKIARIIEAVDNRCAAADGPVTPTLSEMTQAEMSRIYVLARGGA